jgi:beta-galactosidase
MPTRKGGPRAQRRRLEPEGDALQAAAPAAPSVDDAAAIAAASAAEAAAATAEAEAEGAAAEQSRAAVRRNPLFPVGVSLYPLDDESAGFLEAYERDLAPDFAMLAAGNFGLVRLFVPWKVLEPAVGVYDEDGLQRFVDLVRAAGKSKLQVIVCFFADDRHSDITDVGWATKRDPRTDAYLIQREISLVAKLVSRLRAEAAVFAWQLGNEAFLSGFSDKTELDEWTLLLREAIRDLDPNRPIGLGLDVETFFRQTGVDARDAVATCEFAVSHVTAAYRAYAAEGPVTAGPSTYLDGFLLRLASHGVPVLLDEVGPLSLDNSPAEEAVSLRTALWSGLVNRAGGVLARRLRDMTTERREPYYIDPFEMLVGLADAEGELKPSFTEVRRFIRAAAKIDLRSYVPSTERTAVVMPRERFNPLPDMAGLFDPRACLAAFIGAKEAHLPVTVIHEVDDFGGFSVLIVPSAFNLADSTWVRLAAFVQSGGALVLSYGGGDAHPAIRELFGAEFRGDGGPRGMLSCRVAQEDMLGALVGFDAQFAVSNFAQLAPGRATVVATDATGSPLLTVSQVGQGRAVYIAAPLERAIAQGDPWATPEPIRRLVREVYGAVARSAGCGAPVDCDVPEVEVTLYQGVSDDVLVLINHAQRTVTPTLSVERAVASLSDVRGGTPAIVGSPTFGVSLEANAAMALRLSYA